MTYIERDIAVAITEALSEMSVVVVTGMRQTGKSTFLQNQPALKGRRYVTFDDFVQIEAAKADPDGFVNTDEPLTIDEAQKCPEILIAIKKRVDKKRRPGQFLLSGSANFALLKGISESLAGRAVYFTLHPMSLREINKQISEEPFLYKFFKSQNISGIKKSRTIKADDILRGGMPSVCLEEVKNRGLWFKGYEQTYLERDVRELSQITNIISFRHLLHLAALRTGQLLSPSAIGRDAKLTTATTSRYLSLLEISFIINRMPPYLRNRASRIIKSPKMYISDSGLACYLAGIKSLEDEPFKGAMFETYAAQNLSAIINARWIDAQLYFWNVQGRHEVDFIVESGNKCIAVEVKAAARWTDKDLSGLRAFLSSTPHCIAAVLAYNGTESVRLGDKIWAIPVSTVLS
ncbi:MAG: ATP-binding protein [Nitrospiraceae bacterium]|nr:ATP-binding protein [Nitrospirota bacterium]MDA8339036.1 ATP-binding protein [Nitrospiraceae bacterium]